MPVKPPNAPEWTCRECGHLFRGKSGAALLLQLLRGKQFPIPPPCPRCGSRNVGRLFY